MPLVWLSCAVAAVLLSLGVTGTLASWTQAVITNDTNTVATAQAVILRESSGAASCLSSAAASNSSTCSTINKYGGTATPLTPGTNQVTTVTFTDIGAAAASSFVLIPGACSQSPAVGSGTPAAPNLCTSGDLTVAISCSPGTTYSSGSAWTDLAYAAAAPGALPASLTHTGAWAAGGSVTCQFTVALIAGAAVSDQGITLSQPLTWTLKQ